MNHRVLVVLGAGAFAGLYSCSDISVDTAERAVTTSVGSAGSGSALDAGPPDGYPGAGSGSALDAGPPDGPPGAGSGSALDAGPPDAGPPDAGSGSAPGPQIRFGVSHTAENMRDAAAASARLDRLLADDLGGLGSLGYSGCAFDPATVSRSLWPVTVSLAYAGDSALGSFEVTLTQGSAAAEIVCASGPIPPPETGDGSDTSSPGPASGPILDPPPAP